MHHQNSDNSTDSIEANSNCPISPFILKKLLNLNINLHPLIQENLKDPKYKTELCKTNTEKGICPYGKRCRFAHGKEELFRKTINSKKYKIKECHSFFDHHYCNYGSRCNFKHDERVFKEIKRSYYSFLLNNISLIKYDAMNASYIEMIQLYNNNIPSHIRKVHSRFF